VSPGTEMMCLWFTPHMVSQGEWLAGKVTQNTFLPEQQLFWNLVTFP